MARPTPTRQAQTATQQSAITTAPATKQLEQDAFGVPSPQGSIGGQSTVKKIYHIPELTAQAVRGRDQADPLVQMFNQNSDFPITEDDVMGLYEYTKQEHPEITDKQARIEKSLEYIPVLRKMKEEDGKLPTAKSDAQLAATPEGKYAQSVGDYFSGKPISTEREIKEFTSPLGGDDAATPLTALNLVAKGAANIVPNAISTVKSLREIVSNPKQTVDGLKMIGQGIIDKTQGRETPESQAVAKIRKDLQESTDSPEEIGQFLFEHPLDILTFVSPKSVVEGGGTLLRAVKSGGKNAVKAIESATAPTTRAVAGADDLAQIMAGTSVAASETAGAAKMTPEISKYINKSIKPTVINKSQNVKGLDDFEKHALNAVNTIIDNEKNIKLLDESGELVSRTPASVREFADAIDQTKSAIYTEYNTLAQQAGKAGAEVDFSATIDELGKTKARLEKMVGTKDTIKYIDEMIADLEEIKTLNVVDAQQNVQLLNEKLQAFYRNPSHNDVGKAAIDALVNNKLREGLTASIETALDAPEYSVLRSKYASLKAIEKEVNKRAIVLARQSQKGLLDLTDLVSADQVVSGLVKLGYGNVGGAAADIAGGGAMKVIRDYYKSLNSPDVNIRKLFEEVKKQRGVTGQKGADFSKVGTTKVPKNLQSMSNESIIDKDLAKSKIMETKKYKILENNNIEIKEKPYYGRSSNDDGGFVQLHKDGKVVGQADYVMKGNGDDRRGILSVIEINDSLRGKGIGSEFLQVIEDMIVDRGGRKIKAQTVLNPEFFTKKGFVKSVDDGPTTMVKDLKTKATERRIGGNTGVSRTEVMKKTTKGENGELLYHGTDREIDEFILNDARSHGREWGDGIYLTASKEEAKYYAEATKANVEGKKINEIYNKQYTDIENRFRSGEIDLRKREEEIKKLQMIPYSEYGFDEGSKNIVSAIIDKKAKLLDAKEYIEKYNKNAAKAMEAGYDGVRIPKEKNMKVGAEAEHFVIFDPKKIKVIKNELFSIFGPVLGGGLLLEMTKG